MGDGFPSNHAYPTATSAAESAFAPATPSTPHLSLVPDDFDALFDDIEDQWQDRALCAQTDPEAFFPEKGGSTREAKRICSGCEVKAECLEYALHKDERFGIWGGLSERERRRLKRGII
ncbi:WhiB family transcriptional regulator [Williamsia sp. MIQD14]|uniref:WhiB family transcriptional regulator n=1 Tax=Williamsia sp. MIQD14 TaxID=3425703 RepID=UPI003DA0655F